MSAPSTPRRSTKQRDAVATEPGERADVPQRAGRARGPAGERQPGRPGHRLPRPAGHGRGRRRRRAAHR
nr:hypothetical protein [Angustibacter aerolatus]